MRIIGQRNTTCIVQCSTNLVEWHPLATNTVPTGIWDFVTTNADAWPYCFYRVLAQ
jgi:hypothetical protein